MELNIGWMHGRLVRVVEAWPDAGGDDAWDEEWKRAHLGRTGLALFDGECENYNGAGSGLEGQRAYRYIVSYGDSDWGDDWITVYEDEVSDTEHPFWSGKLYSTLSSGELEYEIVK